MLKKLISLFLLSGILILISMSLFAADLSSDLNNEKTTEKQVWRPIVSISTGIASVRDTQTQTLSVGTAPSVQSVYQPDHAIIQQAIVGLFVGASYATDTRFDYQIGLGYYLSPTRTVTGVMQQSLFSIVNGYNYQYTKLSQQLLVEGKLMFKLMFKRELHFLPYVSVGIGAAFNHAGNYTATPQDETSGQPPLFKSQDQTYFSYSVGFGVDSILANNWRLGMGYRYSNLGQINLGAADDGTGTQLQSETLSNQSLLATLTYLF